MFCFKCNLHPLSSCRGEPILSASLLVAVIVSFAQGQDLAYRMPDSGDKYASEWLYDGPVSAGEASSVATALGWAPSGDHLPIAGSPQGLAPSFDPTERPAGSGSLHAAESWVNQGWRWHVLPDGLIYHAYLAGRRESRLATVWTYERELGWIWDVALGGQAGILRYGTLDSSRPQGWQLDIEGAGMPRLDLEHERDVVATDFRFGVPLTLGLGRYQSKFAYYHLSSHLGDEYMLRYPLFERINYSRNVLVWGHSYYLTDDLRLYGEAGWAFGIDGGTEPWEFQFGADFSPARPSGLRGAPFFAVNGHLREEVEFGGNFVVQTGWQWRGYSGHLFRMGMEYFNGKSEQFEFYDRAEQKVGMGVWYDY